MSYSSSRTFPMNELKTINTNKMSKYKMTSFEKRLVTYILPYLEQSKEYHQNFFSGRSLTPEEEQKMRQTIFNSDIDRDKFQEDAQKLSEGSYEALPEISEDDEIAMGYYVSDSGSLNQYLIKGNGDDEDTDNTIKTMDNVISKYKTTKEANVFRGMTLSPEVMATIEKKGEITFKNYVSTSSDASYSSTFMISGSNKKETLPVLFKIKLPKGTKASHTTRKVGGSYSSEREILLPRGTKLKINKVTPITVRVSEKKGRIPLGYYVDATVIKERKTK